MWSMAPVPVAPPCEVRPRYFFWFSPAIFALGPMCTMSTSPRYIQCTGKPKSGCGPLVMPRMRAYQSRVASMSSAATRKCSMCDKRHALIYNDVYLGSQTAQRGGRAQDHGDRDPARQGSQAGGDHRDRRRRRPLDAARAHGRRQVPYRAFGHHQGGMRGVEQARHRIAGRRRARRSTPRTRSASPSPPARSAGPRWKAAGRSWRAKNASAASASRAATGNSTNAWRGKLPNPSA